VAANATAVNLVKGLGDCWVLPGSTGFHRVLLGSFG